MDRTAIFKWLPEDDASFIQSIKKRSCLVFFYQSKFSYMLYNKTNLHSVTHEPPILETQILHYKHQLSYHSVILEAKKLLHMTLFAPALNCHITTALSFLSLQVIILVECASSVHHPALPTNLPTFSEPKQLGTMVNTQF